MSSEGYLGFCVFCSVGFRKWYLNSHVPNITTQSAYCYCQVLKRKDWQVLSGILSTLPISQLLKYVRGL